MQPPANVLTHGKSNGSSRTFLRRQTLATACAASVQDFTAIFCRHACTETVTTSAHKIARLKGTLHCSSTMPFAALFLSKIKKQVAILVVSSTQQKIGVAPQFMAELGGV